MALESETVTVTAPTLTVVWIHDPNDPVGTVRPFRWNGGGRNEERGVVGQGIALAGRKFPVFEFAPRSTRAINIPLLLPGAEFGADPRGEWGDDHPGDIDFIEALLESRRPWVYRDDRGRLIYGVAFTMPWGDEPYGSTIELQLNATDFDESSFYSSFALAMVEGE